MDQYAGSVMCIFLIGAWMLLGTVGKSQQRVVYFSKLVPVYTEATTVVDVTRLIPFDAFVEEEEFTVTTGNVFSADVVLAVDSSFGTNVDEVGNNAADYLALPELLYANQGQIEIQGEHVPQFFYIEGGERNEFNYRRGKMQMVKAGSFVQTRSFISDFGSTLTTGDLSILHKVVLHIISYYRGKGGDIDQAASKHCIFLYDNSGSVKGGYVAPVDGRLGNIRMTVWTNENDFFAGFGKGLNLNTDFPGADAEENLIPGTQNIIISVNSDTSGSYRGVTKYLKGPIFVRRGEVLPFVADTPSSVTTIITIHFDFIPNFNAQGSFAIELEDITEGDNWDSYYEIPYDMYIETLEIDWSASSAGYRGKLHVGIIEGHLVQDQTEPSEFYFGGNLLGDPELINDVKKQDFIVDTVPIVVNVVDASATTNYGFGGSYVHVGRYCKQGDLVMFFKEDMSGSLTTWEYDVKLNYRSRVKAGFHGFDYLGGSELAILNLDDVL